MYFAATYITPCKRATVAKDDCALKSAKIAIPQFIKGNIFSLTH